MAGAAAAVGDPPFVAVEPGEFGRGVAAHADPRRLLEADDAEDDPNGDGVCNLAAYVLGVPALGESQGDGISTSLNPTRDSLVLRFSTPNYVTGVTIATQVSGALLDWQPGPDPVEVDSTAQTTVFEVAVPLSGDAGFARLTLFGLSLPL